MDLFKEFYLMESEKQANKEVRFAINSVNDLYREWKKIKRRVNAVDIASTTANKLSNISPSLIDKVHLATRVKMVSLIIRCLDIPPWKPLSERERIFKKLYPLIEVLQNDNANTGTGGSLREVIITRLSAAFCYQNPVDSEKNFVFVAYEPSISKKYIRYLFGEQNPKEVYKLAMLNMQGDYNSVIDTIRINHEKAVKKYNENLKKI